ncbi:hypothetical protein J6590_015523 [Homalodisca vitripennis]|nr:hypothetical protein J6590_015523 [Homalodisca vitripennis]
MSSEEISSSRFSICLYQMIKRNKLMIIVRGEKVRHHPGRRRLQDHSADSRTRMHRQSKIRCSAVSSCSSHILKSGSSRRMPTLWRCFLK